MAGFSITISAVDQTSQAVDRINAKLEAMRNRFLKPFQAMKAPLDGLTKSLSKFSNLTGISKLGNAIGWVGGKFGKLFGLISKIAGPIGAIFGGGAIALAWKATQTWANYGHQVLMTSGYIGESVEQVQRMRQASRVMGMGPEAMAQTQVSMSDVFEQAVMQPGGTESQLLRQFNINPEGATRFQARNASNEDLLKLSAGVQQQRAAGVNVSSIRQKLSLLGVPPEMQQAIMQGPEYLRKALEQADRSATQTKTQIDLQESENEKLGVLNNNLEQMTLKIGEVTSQAINPLIDSFNNLMDPTKKFGDTLDDLIKRIEKMFHIGGDENKEGKNPSASDAATDALAAGGTVGALMPGGILGKLFGGAIGTLLGFGAKFETPATQAAREANRKAQSVTSPTNMPTNDNAPMHPIGGKTFEEKAPGIIQNLKSDFNLTDEQAQGIVGNLGHESAGLTELQERNPVGGGRGGRGWAMWTGKRRDDFEKWAASMGLDPNSDEANYGFLRHELQTTEKGAIDAVKKTNTRADATVAFEGSYERAGVKNMASRQRYADLAARATPQQKPANGQATVDINLNGFPQGTTTRASAYGDLLGKPSVSMGMGSVLG